MSSRLTTRLLFILGTIVGYSFFSLAKAVETPADSLLKLLKSTNDASKQCEIYVHLADIHNMDQKELAYWEKALKRAFLSKNENVAELALDYLIFNSRWYGDVGASDYYYNVAQKQLSQERSRLFCAYVQSFMVWQKLKAGDVNEVLHETLDKLRNRKENLTLEEQIEWEFLTALSIECAASANEAYQELPKAIPYLEQAIQKLSVYPLVQRYPFELMCSRKLADLYVSMNQVPKATAICEKIMKLHREEEKEHKRSYGFDRVFYDDDTFYYEEYARLLCLPNLAIEDRERYFKNFVQVQRKLNFKDQLYWEALSHYYSEKGEFRLSLLYNDSVIECVKEQEKLEAWVSPYTTRVYLFERLGDFRNAFHTLRRCDSIREQLHSDELRQSMSEMRARFGYNKLALEKLESEDDMRRLAFIAILIILLCIVAWGIHQRLMVRRLRLAQTNLLRSNEEVKKQSLKAGESEKMKTAFIDSMCHEIRTPLNAINGFTDLYFDENLDGTMREEFQKQIQENTHRLTGLLDTMLELSRLISSSEEILAEPTDAYAICMQQMDLLINRNVKPEVECVFEGEECSCTFYSSSAYFTRVVGHLLDNAMKFTESGRIILTCYPNYEKRQMEISVTDTGIGISLDKQEWVFERFTKVDAFMPGTGLGLYMCRLIINKLGGSIYIDATYTTGCRIKIDLPCQEEK